MAIDGYSLVSQCQLAIFPPEITVAIAANAIILGPSSIINTINILEGCNNKVQAQKSEWNLDDIIAVLDCFEGWFYDVDTNEGQIVATGKHGSGEEYRLLFDINNMHSGIGSGGIIAQASFRSGILTSKIDLLWLTH